MADFKPEVTKQEVEQYENTFREKVYPNTKFNVNNNGLSMELYKGDSGTEATFSGTIMLSADNYIKWRYSLQNGLMINSNMELNDESLKVVTNLANFYNEWKSYWEKEMNIAPSAESQEEAVPEAGEESALQESDYTKKRKLSIMNSFDRMRSLSGLK